MVRLILFLLMVAALAVGLSWLADRPGDLVIHWQGYEVQTSVFRAVVLFAVILALTVLVLSIARQIWQSPAAVGHFINRRRQKRGLEALSTGMIAIGAGDRATATRYAIQARKSLPNEPLTHLLRAQAAQLSGDKATARRIFEAMLGSPDTEQLGLRGLFLEAEREGETEAARQFAERAMRLNSKLGWSVEALFDLQCRQHDWTGALETLAVARKNQQVDRGLSDRRRAVLLTAQAQDLEDGDPEKALALAQEAHGLAPGLVPAAAIAGRLLASRGQTPKATRIIQKTWAQSPHPDLSTVYAHARIGDSPRDRLDRVKQLAGQAPNSIESPIAVATAAIEARDFDIARKALESLHAEGRLTHRACLLMARIEGEQHGDRGRVREWLARAVNAPRDPVWTADGVVSERWAAVSPVTGQLDAFQWRVPVENVDKGESELLAAKLEELIALGAPDASAVVTEKVIDGKADAASADAAKPKPTAKPSVRETSVRETIVREASVREAVPSEAEVIDAEPVTTPVRPAAKAARQADAAADTTAPALREATVTVKTAGNGSAPVAEGRASGGASAGVKASAQSAPNRSAPNTSAPNTSAKPAAQPVADAPTAAPRNSAPAAASTPAKPVSVAEQPAVAPPVTAAVTPGVPVAHATVSSRNTTATAPRGPGPVPAQAQPTQRAAGKDGKTQPRMIVPDDPGLGDDDDLPKSPLRSLRAGS